MSRPTTFFPAHLQKHFTDARGVTDFTFENLRATVLALMDSLHWSVPPKNYGAADRAAKRAAANAIGMGHHRTEFDRPELNKPQQSVYELQKEKEETARVNTAKAETEKMIDSYQASTHSRTYRDRDQLRAERDRLVAAKTDPEAIRDAIREKVRQL